MKINLNDNSLMGGGTAVFNNGIAGRVENVRIEVAKRKADEAENVPNYKLIFTDENGSQVNQGFYYHKDNDQYSSEKNEANAGYLIGRILSAAKSVVPEDFVFPDVEGKNVNEIVDILFTIIREHCSDKRVNVFVTYGTKDRASQYLGLRFFDFIERAGTASSRLREKGNDMMERLVADKPMGSSEEKATDDGGSW